METKAQHLLEDLQLGLYEIARIVCRKNTGVTGLEEGDVINDLWIMAQKALTPKDRVKNPWAFCYRACQLKFYTILDKEIKYRKRQERLRRGEL